ncbi:glycosyltransferase [Bacillus cereus]|uniref:glycosyltransferase n=1 Tax=Bacillus cereus TaxID=1396 RepID=UPI003D01FFEE
MRVLQINSVCGIGSTGRIATDIDKVLKDQGHESLIAFGRGNARDCDTTIKIGEKIDNYMHVAKTRLLDMHGFGSNRATKEFIKRIQDLNPDIIHLHNIHGYYVNVELLFDYLKRANKPVVWTLHDCWGFTGHCAHFDYISCNKWKEKCFSCPQKREYPQSIFRENSEKNFLKKKEVFTGVENLTLVTPSRWLADLAKQSFLNEYPIKLINNGIDLETFKPTISNFRTGYNLENQFIILGVASVWSERKGYQYFIELSKRIKADEKIILIGLTDTQIKNLPDNIIGISKTNSTIELAQIYSAADVFVNLTLEDNFPTTNLESLACGTPVITFDTGGSVESVDKNSGFIVEKGNIQEVLNRIKIVKKETKASYSIQCVQRAQDLYSKKDRFNEYVQTYVDLV